MSSIFEKQQTGQFEHKLNGFSIWKILYLQISFFLNFETSKYRVNTKQGFTVYEYAVCHTLIVKSTG